MKNTKVPQKSGQHPEVRQPSVKGAPGSESSKATGTVQDLRSSKDQDGNEQQAQPKAAKP